MAYGNYIAITNWIDVVNLRSNAQELIHPAKIIFVSHLTAYWVTEQPLNKCLAQILDGGQELSPSFWHPLRVPKVHSPDEARSLELNLRMAWDKLAPALRTTHLFEHDITEILALLRRAIATESAIISVLEPPADEERAKQVACPFDQSNQLPVPWNNLSVLFRHLC